jgi:benzoate membrane transport protein
MSETIIERPELPRPRLRDILRDFGWLYVLNGLAGFLFATTGPIAIIISVGTGGGLERADIASWIFGGYALGGVITLIFSVLYRQPLAFAWSIPGAILLASAFEHLSFNEMIGAFIVTGVLMTVLGFSGWVRKAMALIPMPIVMGMVAGIFLSFTLDMIYAFDQAFWIAAPMVLTYLFCAATPAISRSVPPIVVALLAGAVAVAATGTMVDAGAAPALWEPPRFYQPVFTWQAMAELVIPLLVAVLAVQNAQGAAVLIGAGHRPPINAMTVACGIGSVFYAFVGSPSTCVTGPSNALLTSSGEVSRQYLAGITYGILMILFGVFSASTTWLALKLPPAYIATLGGLAVLQVLQRSFITAFSGRFSMGAMITFLITVADISILNIGAAFWGLVFGFAVSWVLERADCRAFYQFTYKTISKTEKS